MKYVRRITVIIFAMIVAIWIGSEFLFQQNVDQVNPVIESGQSEIKMSIDEGEEGLKRGLRAHDNLDGDITDDILVANQSKFIEKGKTEVEFLVFDSSNNVASYSRTVKYIDYESPKFQLSAPLIYHTNDPLVLLDRLSAVDCMEGDITDQMKISSSEIDTSKVGTYYVGVEVKNHFDDRVYLDLPVNIVEESDDAPKISLTKYYITVQSDDEIIPENYISKVKLSDGTIYGSEVVNYESTVNQSVPGVYQILYQCTDANGKTGYTSLTVEVRE